MYNTRFNKTLSRPTEIIIARAIDANGEPSSSQCEISRGARMLSLLALIYIALYPSRIIFISGASAIHIGYPRSLCDIDRSERKERKGRKKKGGERRARDRSGLADFVFPLSLFLSLFSALFSETSPLRPAAVYFTLRHTVGTIIPRVTLIEGSDSSLA